MKSVLALLVAVLAAGCANINSLVPGSSLREVESVMGRPADKRVGPEGETVYWYPQLPYGRANYAARIGADGRLIALEQRLVEQNIVQVTKGWSAAQVYDLLGPPYHPEVYPMMSREAWTYPMRLQGHSYPKWFVVYLSTQDRTVDHTELMDDPTAVPRGTFRR